MSAEDGSDEGIDSWEDIPEKEVRVVSKRRDEIRRQIELGARPDLVDEALDVFLRTQEYTIVKWIRWIWEWCVGS